MNPRKFLSIFAPPNMNDEDSTILAKILNSFLLFGIFTTPVVMILALFLEEDPYPRITLSICYIALFVIAISILHHNQLILSTKILVYTMGALLTLAVFLYDGLQGISFSGYIIIILVASLILSWRDGIIIY